MFCSLIRLVCGAVQKSCVTPYLFIFYWVNWEVAVVNNRNINENAVYVCIILTNLKVDI